MKFSSKMVSTLVNRDRPMTFSKSGLPVFRGTNEVAPLQSHINSVHHGVGPDPNCQACKEIEAKYGKA